MSRPNDPYPYNNIDKDAFLKRHSEFSFFRDKPHLYNNRNYSKFVSIVQDYFNIFFSIPATKKNTKCAVITDLLIFMSTPYGIEALKRHQELRDVLLDKIDEYTREINSSDPHCSYLGLYAQQAKRMLQRD